jgi:uncharacterized membrane protein YdjX (TVP38/TMEM64 family)
VPKLESAPDVSPTGESRPPPTRRRGRWLLAGLVGLAVAGFFALGGYRYLSWESARAHLDHWQSQVRQHLPAAVAVFFLVYVAVTALSLPVAAPLSLVAGALFGRWLGTGVVSLAATLGATLAFLLSRFLLRDWVQRRFGARLRAVNAGIERDGAYYLLLLRLVPAVPFWLINLGMGLTLLRTTTFLGVSWLGMLPGTFLYVNAGTALAAIDSPRDVLAPSVLISLALLGIVPLAIRKLVQRRVHWRSVVIAFGALLLAAAAAAGVRTYFRYRTANEMEVAVREFSNAEYPEDPAHRSRHYGQYQGRTLTLVKKEGTRFDFVFKPEHPHIATVVFKDVDVSLMTPSLPEWTKADDGLRRIALTDRQWNRQQVRFGGPGSAHVDVTGGDGFEREHLFSAELAKNCLNAELWEVLLFTREQGDKALYYQGWFTFPLGHYKDIFERQTGLPYWKHWYYLEHWFDPAGTPVPPDQLRRVVSEREAPATFDTAEPVLAASEQARKRRTTIAENVRTWNDCFDGRHAIRFASFIPPGRYSVQHPWKNEYLRIDRFEKAILREVVSPATDKPLSELELVFRSTTQDGVCRFFVSGFDLDALPRLPVGDYPKGLYMPMGIGVPPFFQSYEELQKNPPDRSPYFSVLLDGQGRWIDHHKFAIDGPVLHRDEHDPDMLHAYLLSYERHSLIAHIVLSTRW